MKKLLCVLAALAFVATAQAELQFFFTKGGPNGDGWGLDEAKLAMYGFSPMDGSTFYAGADDVAGYLLVNGPNGKPVKEIPDGTTSLPNVELVCDSEDFAYLWVHFTKDEAVGTKINGIDRLLLDGACETAYYLCWSGSLPIRWDGDWGGTLGPADLKKNPQSLVAVTSAGIAYTTAANPLNLYYSESAGGFPPKPKAEYGTALLGAMRCCCDDLGLIAPSVFTISTNQGEPHPLGWRFLNTVNCIPEPASLLLLGLAGLFVRRR